MNKINWYGVGFLVIMLVGGFLSMLIILSLYDRVIG